MSGWEPWLNQFPEPAHFAAILDFNGACCCEKNLPGINAGVVAALARDMKARTLGSVQAEGLTLGGMKFTFVRSIEDDSSVVLIFKGKGECKGTLAVKLSNTLVIVAGGQGAGQEEGNVIMKLVENAVEQLKSNNLKFAFVRTIEDEQSSVLIFKGKGECKGTLAVKLSDSMLVIAGGQGAGQEESNAIINTVDNAVCQLKNSGY